jgi:hypothetical protein
VHAFNLELLWNVISVKNKTHWNTWNQLTMVYKFTSAFSLNKPVGGFEGGLGRGGAAAVQLGDFKVVCVWICSDLVHKIPFGFFTGFVLRRSGLRLGWLAVVQFLFGCQLCCSFGVCFACLGFFSLVFVLLCFFSFGVCFWTKLGSAKVDSRLKIALVGWWWILLWWPLGFVLGSVD